MSDNYTSKKIAYHNAEQFKEAFFEPEPTTIGYVYIGNHLPYANEDTPDDISDTVATEKDVWNTMFAAKKVTGSDVELVTTRVNWSANSVFRQYDDTLPLTDLLTANTVQNLKPMYAVNTERNVYLCLSNNVSSNSTVEPTGKNLSANGIIQTSDNYLWKYLFNVRASNKFLSNTWLPCPTSTSKLDYDSSPYITVPGELTTIVVANNGTGYVHSTITVLPFITGCTILTVANTTNLTANMSLTGTGIAGGAHIHSIDTVNSKITMSVGASANGGGSGNNVTVQTRIYIDGDGTGAVANPTLSNGTVQKITVSSYGKNYTRANVLIYGTGTNATARAVLPPKFGHAHNPAKELGASNVMVAVRIGEVDSTENGIISTDTTFRQYGLLRDPYKYGTTVAANTATANLVISQTTDVTLISGTAYNLNEFVYQGPSANAATFSGYVHAYTTNEVRLTRAKGTISIGSPLKGAETNPSGRTVVAISYPEFEPYTGDVLYTENITKTQRIDGQAENLKFVVRF